MRAEEIRELTVAEVQGRILELQEERFRLRFRAATETLEDPLRLRVIRKDIARMQTVLRERELGVRADTAAKSKGKKAAKAGKAAKATSGVRRGVPGSKATRAMRRGFKARTARQQER
jgi:large subunit ribosomal protein L29